MPDQPIPRWPRAMSPDHGALGAAVRETRARRGMSQEGLGYAAGIHRNYVGAIERGEVNSTFSTVLRLARGLALPLSALVLIYERNMGDVTAGE
jgi:transcriptional regulator with XRE-family HTH domain